MAQDNNAAVRLVFGAETGQLEKAITDLQSRLKQVGKNLSKVGSSLSKNVTAPLLAMGAASAKTAIDFEFALAKVQAVSGFTADEMAKLTENARHFGAITAFTASDVAQLSLELAKLGFDSTEIIDMTDGVLSLAQAFDLELGDAAEKVALNLNRFGLASEDATHVADVMAKAFGSSALDAEKLEEALKTTAPTANALGFSLEETTAILGALANAGVSGSIAGTQLTTIFAKMAKEGKNVKEEFDVLLNSTTGTKEAFDRFGARGAKIVPILQNATEEIGELEDGLLASDGAAAKARKTMEETTKGAIKKLGSAMEAAAISIGNALLPAINGIIARLNRLVNWFNALSDEVKTTIVVIAAIVGAVGPVLFIAGQLTIAISALLPVFSFLIAKTLALNAAMMANPYILAAAGAVALYYALSALFDETEKVVTTEEKLATLREQQSKAHDTEAKEVERLVGLYKEASEGSELRRQTIKDLQALNPSYFGDLDAENTKVGDLENAYKNYAKSARAAGIEKAFGDRLAELNAQAVQTEAQLEKLGVTLPDFSGGEKGMFDFAISKEDVERLVNDAGFRMTDAGRALGEQVGGEFGAALLLGLYEGQDEIEAIQDDMARAAARSILDGTGDGAGTGGAITAATNEVLKYKVANDDLAKSMDKLSKAELEAYSQAALDDDDVALAESLESAYRSAASSAMAYGDTNLAQELYKEADAFELQARKAESAKNQQEQLLNTLLALGYNASEVANMSIPQLLAAFDRMEVKGGQVTETLTETKDSFQNFAKQIVDAALGFFDAFAQGLGKAVEDARRSGEKMKSIGSIAKGAFASVLDTLGGILIQVGKQAIATGAAIAAIKKALQTLNPVVAIAAGIALIALAGAVRGNLARQADEMGSVPALAQGGIAVGQQLAIVGDNASGKEAIIPFERMGQFLSEFGGQSQHVIVEGRLSGSDLYLSNERTQLNRERKGGI